ncbi:Auxin-responsive protein IAA27 [Raphanus sativus]|nr:Auxin-responsive protein IAA27 [Raphanus sativus]
MSCARSQKGVLRRHHKPGVPFKEKKSSAAAPASKFRWKVSVSIVFRTFWLSRAQELGWPPIRSFRKNTMASSQSQKQGGNNNSETEEGAKSGPEPCLYVKVSLGLMEEDVAEMG